MVDNGKDILNCGSGNVCYQGKCVSALNATTPVQVWPRSAQDWSYYDRTTSVEVTTPTWKTGFGFSGEASLFSLFAKLFLTLKTGTPQTDGTLAKLLLGLIIGLRSQVGRSSIQKSTLLLLLERP